MDDATFVKYCSIVHKEIKRTLEKKGPLPPDLVHCGAILTEEAGEAAKEANNLGWNKFTPDIALLHAEKMYHEAFQAAAMAILLMERADKICDGCNEEIKAWMESHEEIEREKAEADAQAQAEGEAQAQADAEAEAAAKASQYDQGPEF